MTTRIITSKPPTITAQMLQYLEDYPRSTVRQISTYLGVSHNTINTAMNRARERGLVRHAKHDLGRVVLWELGTEDYLADIEKPEQKRVTSWKPHNFRDPLHVALYGPPSAN